MPIGYYIGRVKTSLYFNIEGHRCPVIVEMLTICKEDNHLPLEAREGFTLLPEAYLLLLYSVPEMPARPQPSHCHTLPG